MVGKDARVVFEGVSHEDLKRGPGHYPGTALPGVVGNMVISGHRTTYGAPFNRVDELHAGDPIVLETRDTWFTYRVTSEQVVAPTAVSVTYPVPGQKGAVPTKRLLTLTTCNPKYSATQRLIVHAILDTSLPKSAGTPPALATGA
jgi:sortase A